MMKKMLAALIAAMLLVACLMPASAFAQEKKLKIVTTIFPIYDWVREIAGPQIDKIELTMLLDSGTDLHNYQPTAADILRIAEADLFLFVGGESDGWVDRAVTASGNYQLIQMNLLEALGEAALTEETVEGMEHAHHHDEDEDEDGHDHEEHDHEEEEAEADEHIWLSLKNAMILVPQIAQKMSGCDPDSSALYAANAAAYTDRLAALDMEYMQAVERAETKTLLFGDRFPFRYLAQDYGLSYYAAFSGCSAETEASFQTIVFLSGKVDELGLHVILTIENPKAHLAETIRENTRTKDQQILSMNSLQSVTAADLEAGVNYLSVMAENLDVLREALK